MGWKNVKDYYKIGHTVCISENQILIGSSYISDLIRVSLDGKVSWGVLGPNENDDLARYYSEMTSDLSKLRELINSPDTFAASKPVFTWKGGEIIEKQCEEYGWPNVTHDGCIQYNNYYSEDKKKVIEWAKDNTKSNIKWESERMERLRKELRESLELVRGYEQDLFLLEINFPSI